MPAQSDDPDRVALTALYNSAGGPRWTNNDNWLSDAPIGKWYGVTTDDTGRVIILDLMENQLSGEIPEELVGLSNLELLTLSGNQLSGCIPARLRGVEGNDLSDLGLPVCTPVESTEWDRAALVAFYRATGGPNWPRRESGMTPYEVMLSESQERMLVIVERGLAARVRAIFDRWGLTSTIIGEITDDGRARIYDGNELVCDASIADLAEAPEYTPPSAEPYWLAALQ